MQHKFVNRKSEAKVISLVENWTATKLVLISLGVGGTNDISTQAKRRKLNKYWELAIRIIHAVAVAWAWAFSASLVRIVAPNRSGLERHEFESVELRRGGFGGLF